MTAYDHGAIEKAARGRWEREGVYRARGAPPGRKFYCLDMFPYPSGTGLHVGHWRNYTLSDIISRYRRLRGYDVLHPMGWDAFGLPAENYALCEGVPPAESTERNIAEFRRQLSELGAMYDWEREVNTSDPVFYRWTQWIFLKLLEHGLAYRADQYINWCPGCKTGLANEEVVQGLCERCGSPIVRRRLPQWMLRITAYAERLLDDLERLDWPDHIKRMQANWIGRSEGALIRFEVKGRPDKPVAVFTSRPDTLAGVTFVALAPEHDMVSLLTTRDQEATVSDYLDEVLGLSSVERLQRRNKTGVWLGSHVIHPLTGAELPVWVADYVLYDYGTGAVMGVPAHDERDLEFARQYSLPVMDCPLAPVDEVIDTLQERGAGARQVGYRLRDWVFSRQRYWGEPIPVVHCPRCGVVPLPEDELPLLLPEMEEYQPSGTGRSPLVNCREWVHTECPQCGGEARRETDTMPQWAGSSWYFLRYADPRNRSALAAPEKLRYWLPVDLYVGGAEHATLHLLYARFFTKFLYDIGAVEFDEPFTRYYNQGMVLMNGRRMSKSRGNVVNPDPLVATYGADALRTYEAFIGAPDEDVEWHTEGIVGVRRFLERLYQLVTVQRAGGEHSDLAADTQAARFFHRALQDVTERLDGMRFNTAVSRLMELTRDLEQVSRTREIARDVLEGLVLIVAPFAPHLAEHLWGALGHGRSIWAEGQWPAANEELAVSRTCTLPVQVNGRLRATVELEWNASRDEAVSAARAALRENGEETVGEPARVVYVAGKVVNFVTR